MGFEHLRVRILSHSRRSICCHCNKALHLSDSLYFSDSLPFLVCCSTDTKIKLFLSQVRVSSDNPPACNTYKVHKHDRQAGGRAGGQADRKTGR